MSLQQMQEHVMNAAMDRHIADLQKEAKTAVKQKEYYENKVRGGLDDERNEYLRRRQAAQNNQHLLREQMEENKCRRAEGRRDFIESASAHSFPLFTETFISQDGVAAYRKPQKERFREEL